MDAHQREKSVVPLFKLGLSELEFNRADPRGIAPELAARLQRRLRALQAATKPTDLDVPGFDFHALKGKPKRYSVPITGRGA